MPANSRWDLIRRLRVNAFQSVVVEGSCFHKRSTGEYTAIVALKLRVWNAPELNTNHQSEKSVLITYAFSSV